MMWLPDTPQDHDNRMYEAGRADAADRIAELEAALRMVDEDVRHHIRSDEITHAMIRKRSVQAVRDALKSK